MKVESSIKETYSTVSVQPTTNTEEIIKAICEWNGITLEQFKTTVGDYVEIGKDNNGNPIYLAGSSKLINPIGVYLMNTYDGKDIVFEKGNDKFFGVLRVRAEQTKYMLGETAIDIPFRITAVNEGTGESIIIFPKTSDIVQKRMKGMYVVSTGWSERQRLEKEIMAKLIELAQIKGGNEIISTQNMLEDLKAYLKKQGIDFELGNELIYLDIPRRMVRDTNGTDNEYIAPPIKIEIDFYNKSVKCKGYSAHGFGTPSSWGNPCWGNRDNEIYNCLQDCSLRELVNLIISWAYGYNSHDTGMSHEGRHPLAKLRDYMWYLNDNQNRDSTRVEIEKAKEHLEEIKGALNIDDWLSNCSTIRNFISSLEKEDETAE